MTVSLSRQAWPQVPAHPLVLVPVGSTEQHGPHLPFTTDTLIATAVVDGAAAVLSVGGEDVVVAPALGFGASGEHQSFPGTISIGHEALRVVLVELVRSLSTWAGRIVFVNGHGGNVPTLASAVPQLVGEGHAVSWLPCSAPAEALRAAGIPEPDAHAGRTETSLMLRIAPDSVARPLPSAGAVGSLAALLPQLSEGGVRSVSPSGILGDPSGANAEEGGRLLAAAVAEAVRLVEHGHPDARGMLRMPPTREGVA